MTAASAARPMLERRKERRVAVQLPILVRGTSHAGEWFEERTTSLDLCRGGAAFATRHMIDLGASVEINIPPASWAQQEESEFATHGRVVRLAAGQGGAGTIVGVQFTGPHFHRMFVSEGS